MAQQISSAQVFFDREFVPVEIVIQYMDDNYNLTSRHLARPSSSVFPTLLAEVKTTRGLCYWISHHKHSDGESTLTIEHMYRSLSPSQFDKLLEGK